jgi:hypothetical protein
MESLSKFSQNETSFSLQYKCDGHFDCECKKDVSHAVRDSGGRPWELRYRSEDPRAARKKKLSLVQLGEHMGSVVEDRARLAYPDPSNAPQDRKVCSSTRCGSWDSQLRFRTHLKNHHGFERLRLRGLSGARDEFHLAAIVQNLKTLALRLVWPPPHLATASVA